VCVWMFFCARVFACVYVYICMCVCVGVSAETNRKAKDRGVFANKGPKDVVSLKEGALI